MDQAELFRKLEAADAAGNTEDAKVIAGIIRSGQAAPAAEVPQGGTIADPLLQGASFGFADEVEGGLGAAYQSAKGLFTGQGKSFRENYQSIRNEARQRNADYKERNPTTALLAEMAGGLVTGGAGAARVGALRGAQSVGKLAGIGAAEGGIYGAGASEADTLGGVAQDAAVGAGLGAGTAGGLGLALRGAGRALQSGGDDAAEVLQREAADTLERAGVNLTTAQRSGSGQLAAIETNLSGMVTGGKINEVRDKSARQFQSKLMDMAGFAKKDIDDGLITSEAIDRAGKKLGGEYDKFLKGKKIDLTNDADYIDALADVELNKMDFLGRSEKNSAQSILDEFLGDTTKKPLTGREYQKLRSKMGKRARNNAINKADVADVYSSLQGALDKAFMRQTGDSARPINRKYAHYMQLEKVQNALGGKKVTEGFLPLNSLVRLAKKKSSPTSPEWNNFIESGQRVFGDNLPNSGTASRLADIGMVAGAVGMPSVGVPAAAGTWLASQALGRGVGSSLPAAIGGATNAIGRGVGSAAPAGVLAAPAATSQGLDPAQSLLDGLL